MALDRNIGSSGTGGGLGTLGTVATVETVSALKTFTGPEDMVIIQGSIAAGDLGSAKYYWNSTSTDTADDIDTVQSAGVTTGRWKRIVDYRKIVNSIASLKLIEGIIDDQIINVSGYYDSGDGGGGDFYWDSTSTDTADDGTIIQVTGVTNGRWKRVYSGGIHVSWFGAKGDGSTDDTTNISNAITAATGDVYFKANSEYIISGTITCPGTARKRLISDNSDARFSLTAASGFTGIMIQVNAGGVIGCTIEGSDNSVTAHKGIEIGDATYVNVNCKLENLRFNGGLYDGIHTTRECDTSQFSLIHCFTTMGRSVIHMDVSGIYPPTAGLVIEEVHFNNPEVSPPVGYVKKNGIYLSRCDGFQIKSSIVNGYDACLNIGDTNKVYNSLIATTHMEDHRTVYQTAWAATTAISLNDYRRPTAVNANGHYYICTSAGTTGGTEPTWPTTDAGTVVDGTVTWTEIGEAVGIRMGQCDQISINNVWLDDNLSCLSIVGATVLDLDSFRAATAYGAALYTAVSTASQIGVMARSGSFSGTIHLEGSTNMPYFGQNVAVDSNSNTTVPDHKGNLFMVYGNIGHGVTPLRILHTLGTANVTSIPLFEGRANSVTKFLSCKRTDGSAESYIAYSGGGGMGIGTGSQDSIRADNATSAGTTRFMLYDNDNGTLERVTVGAADSGGAGYKVLRIPN